MFLDIQHIERLIFVHSHFVDSEILLAAFIRQLKLSDSNVQVPSLHIATVIPYPINDFLTLLSS